MKIDLYTKFVLTVIAISLSAIAVQHTIPNAFAQQNNQPVKVSICELNPVGGYSGGFMDASHCANIDGKSLKVHTEQ
jgi:hypothetical protein